MREAGAKAAAEAKRVARTVLRGFAEEDPKSSTWKGTGERGCDMAMWRGDY
jgi:hypothetical protein